MSESNVQKMREAVELAERELRIATESSSIRDNLLVYPVGCLRTVAAVCRSALSAPPRNCDLYMDAPSAYANFIVPWKLDGHLDDVPTLQDFANWLFAPAAERKGEDDGSK